MLSIVCSLRVMLASHSARWKRRDASEYTRARYCSPTSFRAFVTCSKRIAPSSCSRARRRSSGRYWPSPKRRARRGISVSYARSRASSSCWSRNRISSNCVFRSEEHTSELQSRLHLVCRLLLEKKNKSNSPRAIVFPILINAQAHNVDRSYSVLLTRHLTLPVTHTHDSLHSHTRRRSALLNTAD